MRGNSEWPCAYDVSMQGVTHAARQDGRRGPGLSANMRHEHTNSCTRAFESGFPSCMSMCVHARRPPSALARDRPRMANVDRCRVITEWCYRLHISAVCHFDVSGADAGCTQYTACKSSDFAYGVCRIRAYNGPQRIAVATSRHHRLTGSTHDQSLKQGYVHMVIRELLQSLVGKRGSSVSGTQTSERLSRNKMVQHVGRELRTGSAAAIERKLCSLGSGPLLPIPEDHGFWCSSKKG